MLYIFFWVSHIEADMITGKEKKIKGRLTKIVGRKSH